LTTPQRPAPARDSKSNLYEAALAAVKEREDAAGQRRHLPQETRVRWMTVLLLVALVAAILLLVRPVWLAGPQAPIAESPPLAAASLRLTLLRERQRVFDFLRINGRLPGSLGEAGVSGIIRYEITGPGAFRMTASAGDSVITLTSSDSLGAFLGTSLHAIRNRGRQ
jgi:hypothetical protein